MARSQPRWPGTVATVLGCLWLGLFPLWQDMTYGHITRTKWIGLLVLCGATVLSCLVTMLMLARRRQLRQCLHRHPAQLLALAYFLWVALSAWQGQWAGAVNGREQPVVLMGAIRYEGLLTHLCYFLVFLMMSLFPARLHIVLQVAAEALVLFCCLVAVQYAGVNPLGLFPEGRSIYANYEFQGTIGNIDMVSGYLCLVIPLFLGSFVTREKGGWYLLAAGSLGALLAWCIEVQSGLIALALLCALLVLALLCRPDMRPRALLALAGVALALGLRGMLFLPWLDSATPREPQPVRLVMTGKALLGMGAAGLLAGAALLFRHHPGKAVPWRPLLCVLLACAVLCAAAVVCLPIPESAGALWELHECLNGRVQDAFGSWRLGAWRHSLAMAAESPLFGNGPDTFYYAIHHRLDTLGETLGENFDNPHNEYVAILVNNGAPALVLYLAFLAVLLAFCWRRKQWAPGMAIVCFAAQGFFSFSICLISPMFWAVLGMAAALCGKAATNKNEVHCIGNELRAEAEGPHSPEGQLADGPDGGADCLPPIPGQPGGGGADQ